VHKEWRKILFRIGLVFGLIIFLQQAWEGYLALGQQKFYVIRPLCLLASLALCMVANFLQMGAWVIILQSLSRPISLRQTMQGFLISFLPRYIPGGVWGYLSRSQWLREFCGIDYTASIVGSVLEVIGLILTALNITVFFLITRLIRGEHDVLVLFTGVLCGVFLWFFTPILVLKFTAFIWPGVENLAIGVKDITNFPTRYFPLHWLLVGLIYIMLWIAYGISILLIATAVSPIPTDDSLLGATFSIATAWVLGFAVFFAPAGLGVREIVLSRLLASSLALTTGQGSLVAVIFRLNVILAELIWLVIGSLLSIPWKPTKSEHHTCAEFHRSK